MSYLHRFFYIFASLLFALSLQAQIKSDRVWTEYKSGVFSSYAVAKTKAPLATANQVTDDLIDQFRGDPERLFDWALKGLGTQGDDSERDEILLVLKKTTLDKMTGINCLLVDIKIDGKTAFKDIEIKSKVVKTIHPNGTTEVSVDIFYSNALLKKAYGTFFVVPISKNEVQLRMDIHVRFGWFFNIFITQKRFKNMIEWRLDGFVDNLRAECERRATSQKK